MRLPDYYILNFQEDCKIIMNDPWNAQSPPLGHWSVSAAPGFNEITVEVMLPGESYTSTYKLRRVRNTNTWLTAITNDKEQFLVCDFL